MNLKPVFPDDTTPRVFVRPTQSHITLTITPTPGARGAVLLCGESSNEFPTPGWPVLPHFVEINGGECAPITLQLASRQLEVARLMQQGNVQVSIWAPTRGALTSEESGEINAFCKSLWGDRDIVKEYLGELKLKDKRAHAAL
jgi:hypothetical protein